jgi:hypothetical protein
MKFTLTYDGDLPSSGNKSTTPDVSRIRNYFHDQLVDLWDSHIVLRELARTARVPKITIYTERRRDMPVDRRPIFRSFVNRCT